MEHLSLFFCVISIPFVYPSTSPSGSVELDDYSFDKIVGKFQASLVKFDVAFPYGDKHEAFVALAKEAKNVDELLVAEVGVKDYGEKDNEALALKYGATKDNFPTVKLFVKGKEEPHTFDDTKGFTTDDLRQFVREKTGLYLSLPGCLRGFDKLAIKFMKATKDDRKKLLKDADKVLDKIPKKDVATGKMYKTIMEKVLEKGDQFISTEIERVKKLLNSKVSEEKKKEIGLRINILTTFQLNDITEKNKDEL